MLTAEILSKLRPHQVEPAKRLHAILSSGQNAVDLSDTGTGKTFVASAVMVALRVPTLVVVPKVSVSAWERAAAHFNDVFDVVNYEKLRTGRTPFGQWENTPPAGYVRPETFVCQSCQLKVDLENYSPCYCHPQGFHCLVTKKQSWRYGRFIFAPEVKAVVFDEFHRCGGLDSLNADLMIAAKRDEKITLGLSATAACNPLQMRAPGYLLGLHALGNFNSWAGRYGCRRDPAFGGLRWMVGADKQRAVMADIRDKILPSRGVRVSVNDIPGFPERDISAELYDLDEAGMIDKLYAQMAEAIDRLKHTTINDKAPDHPLTMILRARQKIEILKVPVMVELTEDYVAKGHSVACFVNFRETMNELRRRLKCEDFIDGSAGGVKNRQRSIDRFQANETPVILANSQAGGISVSLHDLQGDHPRVGLVMPDFSADKMKQVFGRLHRDGGKSKCFYRVLFAAKTVETKIHRAVSAKLNNLDALNDLDLAPGNLHLTRQSITEILSST